MLEGVGVILERGAILEERLEFSNFPSMGKLY